MFHKLTLTLISFLLIITTVFCGMTFLYFALPSPKAMSTIDLPEYVEDSQAIIDAANSTESEEPAAIYLADVLQSLTLRTDPDSKANSLADLPPMTHLKMLELANESFAYIEVETGEYKGFKGYVNINYITPLGERTNLVNLESD